MRWYKIRDEIKFFFGYLDLEPKRPFPLPYGNDEESGFEDDIEDEEEI